MTSSDFLDDDFGLDEPATPFPKPAAKPPSNGSAGDHSTAPDKAAAPPQAAPAADLPPPPVPADADLRGFRRMPLDVVALLNSDFTVETSGDEFKAGVRLWCTAWQQVPAGSLPDSDKALAKFAGFEGASRVWKRIRPAAMRGWYLCSDGRLYHDFLAEVVALVLKVQAARKKGNRVKRSQQAYGKSEDGPGSSEHSSNHSSTRSTPARERRGDNKPLTPAGGLSVLEGLTEEQFLKAYDGASFYGRGPLDGPWRAHSKAEVVAAKGSAHALPHEPGSGFNLEHVRAFLESKRLRLVGGVAIPIDGENAQNSEA